MIPASPGDKRYPMDNGNGKVTEIRKGVQADLPPQQVITCGCKLPIQARGDVCPAHEEMMNGILDKLRNAQAEEGAEALHLAALGMARVLEMQPIALPRLMLGAAWKAVENRLIRYRKMSAVSRPVEKPEVLALLREYIATLGEAQHIAQSALGELETPKS